jgi:hypothetical protein
MFYFIHTLMFCFGWMLLSLLSGNTHLIIKDLLECIPVIVFAILSYTLGYVKREN